MPGSDIALENDPYQRFIQEEKYQKNLIEIDKSSKFSKKWNRLRSGMSAAKTNMLNGAMMGFMVGGLFGLVVGVYSAIQTRRLLAIPMSVLVSGGSFGFILGCGSVIRSDTLIPEQPNYFGQERIEEIVQLRQGEWRSAYEFNRQQRLRKNRVQESL